METDRIGNLALPGSSASRAALAAANGLDRLITRICRFVVLVTGIALTAILTGSVAARYVFAAGGSMQPRNCRSACSPGSSSRAPCSRRRPADTWRSSGCSRSSTRPAARLLLFGNAIVIVSYLVLCQQALEVAEIAKLERSPVLGLPGSHGYWAVALGCVLLAVRPSARRCGSP